MNGSSNDFLLKAGRSVIVNYVFIITYEQPRQRSNVLCFAPWLPFCTAMYLRRVVSRLQVYAKHPYLNCMALSFNPKNSY